MKTLFHQVDLWRRALGQGMECFGYGPAESPGRIVFEDAVFALKAYSGAVPEGPPLLLVPAPIKRAYIWDLLPGASVVRRLLERGLRVFLLQWRPAPAAEREAGLAVYAGESIHRSLAAMAAETGSRGAFIYGHSLGGTLAAIYSALHPGDVLGLVLLSAPCHFGPGAHPFRPFLPAAPSLWAATALWDDIPGSWLNFISELAAPGTFLAEPWQDWRQALTEAAAGEVYFRALRWALDELSLPGRLFVEVAARLYRDNAFLAGELTVDGRPALPERITAPVLSVVERHSGIAPSEAVLPFHQTVSSREKQLLWYSGDTGVFLQHLGVLVGQNAHRTLWPAIIDWTWDLATRR